MDWCTLCATSGAVVLDVVRPAYTNLDLSFVQINSSSVATRRFDGALNVDWFRVKPCILFRRCGDAPLILADTGYHDKMPVAEITVTVIESVSMMVKCDPLPTPVVATISKMRDSHSCA